MKDDISEMGKKATTATMDKRWLGLPGDYRNQPDLAGATKKPKNHTNALPK
jgi:hypothetical protein